MGYTGAERYAFRSELLAAGIAASRYLENPTQQTFLEKSKVASRNPTYQQMIGLLRKEAQAAANYPGKVAIFYGDSIIQSAEEYKASSLLSFNQGISGDTTKGILKRLDLGSQFMTKASEIVLGGGINDLKTNPSARTVSEIIENKKASVKMLREKSPQAQITVLSILPTNRKDIPPSLIQSLNERLKVEFSGMPNVVFADFTKDFEDPQQSGRLKPGLTTDGLHLNDQGYRLFYELLNKNKTTESAKNGNSTEVRDSKAAFQYTPENPFSSAYVPFLYSPAQKLTQAEAAAKTENVLTSIGQTDNLAVNVLPLRGPQVPLQSQSSKSADETDVLNVATDLIKSHNRQTQVSAWIESPFFVSGDSEFLQNNLQVQIAKDELSAGGQRVYLDPLNPAVQQRLLDLVASLSRRPDVQAIEIDDNFSIKNKIASEVIKMHALADKAALSEELTKFLRKLKQTANGKPLVFSYNGSIEHHAKQDSQDIRAWIKEGLIDELSVQLYRDDLKIFKKDFERELSIVKELKLKKFGVIISEKYRGQFVDPSISQAQIEYIKMRAAQEKHNGIEIKLAAFNPSNTKIDTASYIA